MAFELRAAAQFEVVADLNEFFRTKQESECKKTVLAQYQILLQQYGDGTMLSNARNNHLPNPVAFTESEFKRQASALLAAIQACG